ncbi:MAG: FtsX-like permease family protein [Spirochaetota bacterium]
MALYRIAYCNILHRKTHALLSFTMIVILTSVFFFSQEIVWGMFKGVDISINRLGADIIVLPQKMGSSIEIMLFSPEPMNVYLPNGVIEQITDVPGISRFSPQFFAQTLNKSCCSLGGEYRLVGFDQATDFVLQAWLEEKLKRSLKDNEIIIGKEVPSFLGGRAVILDGIFTVAGRLESTGSLALDETIFMPINKARELAALSPYLSHLWDGDYRPENLISAVLIKIENQGLLYEAANQLAMIPGVQVNVMSNLALQAKNNILLAARIMYLLFIFIWIIAVVSIGNHFLAEVFRRKKEIGIIRAVGGRPPAVVFMFLLEAGLLSLIGAIAGLLLGFVLVQVIETWLVSGNLITFAAPGIGVMLNHGLLSILIAFGTGLLTVIYPAIRASRVDPATAIARGEL